MGSALARVSVSAASESVSQPVRVADLEKAERAVTESLRHIERVLSDEIEAGQLKQSDAHGDSMQVQQLLGFAERGDMSRVDFFARGGGINRSGNAKVAAAWESFNRARDLRRDFVKDKLPALIANRLQNAASVWRTAARPADLSAAISELRGLRQSVERLRDFAANDNEERLGEVIEFLEKSKELLFADVAGDAVLTAYALREVGEAKISADDFLSFQEREGRRRTMIVKLREHAESILKESMDALPKVTRAEELTPMISRLHEAADVEEILTQREQGVWIDRFEQAERAASDWRRMLATEEAGYWLDAGAMAKELAPAARKLSVALGAHLVHRGAADERRGQNEDHRDTSALASAVGKINNAADARALAMEVRGELDGKQRSTDGAREIASLGSDLEQLSRIPSTLNEIAGSAGGARSFNQDHPWMAQIAAAAERVRRSALVAWSGRPELNEGPLTDVPLEEALDQLATAAAKREDWREAIDLLTLKAVAAPNLPPSGEAAAIRSFLMARNFERAEIFDEAATLYSAVLRGTGTRTPSAQAAERLKQLTRKISGNPASSPP